MPVPDVVKGPSAEVPKTLGEAAANVEGRVTATSGAFREKVRMTLEGEKALKDMQRRTQRIVKSGVEHLSDAGRLLEHQFGISAEAVRGKIAPVREKRDESLYREDYAFIAEAYRKFHALKRETDDKGMTDYQMKQAATAFIMEKTQEREPHIAKHLKHKEVLLILDKDYDNDSSALETALQDLKGRLVLSVQGDGEMSDDQKFGVQSSARNIIDVIRLMKESIDTMEKCVLSEQGVAGAIGRVLDQPEMDKVFGNDFEPLNTLPDGSVRLMFADGEREYYHQAGQDDMPAEIKATTEEALPRHILLVHYRTDEDVGRLLEDLSAGEELSAVARDNAAQDVVLEGRSDPDVNIKENPGNVDRGELIAHPMKYLSHDIEVRVPMKAATPFPS